MAHDRGPAAAQIHGLKTIGITTNGILVGRKLPTLAECVDQINISLDTLDPMKFVLITRRNGWERVRAAIDLAIDAAIPQATCTATARARASLLKPTAIPRLCACMHRTQHC